MSDEMIHVTCTKCGAQMEMPKSFLEKGVPLEEIHQVCDACVGKMTQEEHGKMAAFFHDVEQKLEQLDDVNEYAEQIAEDMTDAHVGDLIAELLESKDAKDQLLTKAFFQGVWTLSFVLGQEHGKDFLKEQKDLVKKFNDAVREREKEKREKQDDS